MSGLRKGSVSAAAIHHQTSSTSLGPGTGGTGGSAAAALTSATRKNSVANAQTAAAAAAAAMQMLVTNNSGKAQPSPKRQFYVPSLPADQVPTPNAAINSQAAANDASSNGAGVRRGSVPTVPPLATTPSLPQATPIATTAASNHASSTNQRHTRVQSATRLHPMRTPRAVSSAAGSGNSAAATNSLSGGRSPRGGGGGMGITRQSTTPTARQQQHTTSAAAHHHGTTTAAHRRQHSGDARSTTTTVTATATDTPSSTITTAVTPGDIHWIAALESRLIARAGYCSLFCDLRTLIMEADAKLVGKPQPSQPAANAEPAPPDLSASMDGDNNNDGSSSARQYQPRDRELKFDFYAAAFTQLLAGLELTNSELFAPPTSAAPAATASGANHHSRNRHSPQQPTHHHHSNHHNSSNHHSSSTHHSHHSHYQSTSPNKPPTNIKQLFLVALINTFEHYSALLGWRLTRHHWGTESPSSGWPSTANLLFHKQRPSLSVKNDPLVLTEFLAALATGKLSEAQLLFPALQRSPSCSVDTVSVERGRCALHLAAELLDATAVEWLVTVCGANTGIRSPYFCFPVRSFGLGYSLDLGDSV